MAGGHLIFRGLPFHLPFEKPVHNALGIFLVLKKIDMCIGFILYTQVYNHKIWPSSI